MADAADPTSATATIMAELDWQRGSVRTGLAAHVGHRACRSRSLSATKTVGEAGTPRNCSMPKWQGERSQREKLAPHLTRSLTGGVGRKGKMAVVQDEGELGDCCCQPVPVR